MGKRDGKERRDRVLNLSKVFTNNLFPSTSPGEILRIGPSLSRRLIVSISEVPTSLSPTSSLERSILLAT